MSANDAVLYARVSTKDQMEEGFSIDSQLLLLNEYAKGKSLRIVESFVDVESAKKPGRPRFNAMVRYLRTHPDCRTVLVEKTDRLHRNLPDFAVIDGLDIQIHFVKENSILSRNSRPSEKLAHGLLALLAKNYSDNLSEESRKGMTEKARQGMWPSFAPIGYTNVIGADKKKYIEPDPVFGPMVVRLFEEYARGDCSVRELTRFARKMGLVTRKEGQAYSISSIQRILRNPLYKGDVVWNGITYSGTHTPLVTRGLWTRVQDLLDEKRVLKGRKVRHSFIFARMVRCGHCGGLITGQVQKGHVYYHCSGYRGKCPEPYVREERIEACLEDVLRRLEGSEAFLGWVEHCLERRKREWRETHEKALSLARADEALASQRYESLYEDRQAGKVPDWLYDKKAAEYSAELAEKTSRVREIEADKPVDMDKLSRTFELAKMASASYSALPKPEKRKVALSVLSNCQWKDGCLTASLRQPYGLIADAIALMRTVEPGNEAEKGLFRIWRSGRDSNPQLPP